MYVNNVYFSTVAMKNLMRVLFFVTFFVPFKTGLLFYFDILLVRTFFFFCVLLFFPMVFCFIPSAGRSVDSHAFLRYDTLLNCTCCFLLFRIHSYTQGKNEGSSKNASRTLYHVLAFFQSRWPTTKRPTKWAFSSERKAFVAVLPHY